jgi:hypothetical protein
VDICPAKEKALEMKSLSEIQEKEDARFRFAESLPELDLDIAPTTVRGSQFRKPLFEYSGACAGCGETPYIKVVTQLFGQRMVIANATGCSSIYGGNAPTVPYTVDSRGRGPAWASSLFEDNAEFGYGYSLGINQQRSRLIDLVNKALAGQISAPLKEALQNWLVVKDDGEASMKAADQIRELLELEKPQPADKVILDEIKENQACSQSARSGFSVVTVGLTILAMADWIMLLPPEPMLTSWYSIPRFTPIPVDNLPRRHQQLRLPSLPLPARRCVKKI